MRRALAADGEKLRQLTGEDHGPHCPECFGAGVRDTGGVTPWGEYILVHCDCEDDAKLRAGTHYLDANGRLRMKETR